MLLNIVLHLYDGSLTNTAILALSLILNSYKTNNQHFKIFTTGLLITIAEFFTYDLTQTIRTILNLIICFTIIKWIFRLKMVRSLLLNLTYQALGMIIIGILSLILVYFFGITTDDYRNSVPLRLCFPFVCIIPTAILYYTAYRRNWRIFSDSPRLKLPVVLILPVIAQFITLMIITNEIFFIKCTSWDTFKLNGIIAAILLFSFILNVLFLWQVFRSAEREAYISSQIQVAAQMKQYNDVIRSQRHDFVNHLQVINALFQEEQMQALAQYVEEIKQEII